MKVYANLPINIRDDIVLTVERENDRRIPITWNVAYVEISNDTELGKKIFNKLVELQII